MGYDLFRFQEQVDEELICPICRGVLEEPLVASRCEHAFCKCCINEWLLHDFSCPIDRQLVTPDDLKLVPRILRNCLSRLLIKCDNASLGCTVLVQLEHLKIHLEECEYDPERPVQCEKGCGLILTRGKLSQHNCIRELRSEIHEIRQDITDLLNLQIDLVKCSVKQLQREPIRELRNEMKKMRQDIESLKVDMKNCNSMMQTENSKYQRLHSYFSPATILLFISYVILNFSPYLFPIIILLFMYYVIFFHLID